MEKVPNWELLVCSSKSRIILIGIWWMISKKAGRKQNTAPMWKKLMKLLDLRELTSFLDHMHFGYTQRECKPNESIIDEYNNIFESRISAGATENTGMGKTSRKKGSVVQRNGRTCEK